MAFQIYTRGGGHWRMEFTEGLILVTPQDNDALKIYDEHIVDVGQPLELDTEHFIEFTSFVEKVINEAG